jgi:hypothetical protein
MNSKELRVPESNRFGSYYNILFYFNRKESLWRIEWLEKRHLLSDHHGNLIVRRLEWSNRFQSIIKELIQATINVSLSALRHHRWAAYKKFKIWCNRKSQVLIGTRQQIYQSIHKTLSLSLRINQSQYQKKKFFEERRKRNRFSSWNIIAYIWTQEFDKYFRIKWYREWFYNEKCGFPN